MINETRENFTQISYNFLAQCEMRARRFLQRILGWRVGVGACGGKRLLGVNTELLAHIIMKSVVAPYRGGAY